MSQRIHHLFSITIKSLALLFSVLCQPLLAHETPSSKVMLDIGVSVIGVEMQLPLEELRLAMDLPNNTTASQLTTTHKTQLQKYLAASVEITTPNGQRYNKRDLTLTTAHVLERDWVIVHINFTMPDETSTQSFLFNNELIVDKVTTHNMYVSVRRDFRNGIFDDSHSPARPYPILGLLHYQQKQLKVEARNGGWIQGTAKVFNLGMQHIAEGTDHILFLLALLLVAPLGATRKRWNQAMGIGESLTNILKTVTGFTLGHSLTLALGATGLIQFPTQPIEVLIAVSILISATHAIRPLFSKKEHWVAAFFGLIHGMAFASSLTGFDYDTSVLGLAVLGFNLGLEAMQLFIVALLLPALLLLSGTAWYRPVRISAAIFTGLLALTWVLERAFGIANPLNTISNLLTEHALVLIATLTLLGLAARAQVWLRGRKFPLSHIHYRNRISL